jgi:hypothetical protein
MLALSPSTNSPVGPSSSIIRKTKSIQEIYDVTEIINLDDCRTGAASRRKHPPSKSNLKWQMCGDKEFLFFISGKIEWELPSSILVTRNPNWSQKSGTGTG